MRSTAATSSPSLAFRDSESSAVIGSLEKYDIVIVGAGVAGMVAARECLRAGLAVKLLESSDRVGGRLHAVLATGGQTLELGGEFFRPWAAPRLAGELRRYGISTGPAYAGDQQLVFDHGRLHPLAEVIGDNPAAIKALIAAVRDGALGLGTSAGRAELENTKVSEALGKLQLPPLLKTWFCSWIENYAGTSLDLISAASMLGLVESSGGSLRAASVVSGSHILPDTLTLTGALKSSVAEALELNRQAFSVERADNGREYFTQTESGAITSRAIIIAAPRNVIAAGRLRVDTDWRGAPPQALSEPHPGLGCKTWVRLDENAPPRTMILGRMGGFRSAFIGNRLEDGSMWAALFGSKETLDTAGTPLHVAARESVQQAFNGRVQTLETAGHDWATDPHFSAAWTVTAAHAGSQITELHQRCPQHLAFAGADFASHRGGVDAALDSGFAAAEKVLKHFSLIET